MGSFCYMGTQNENIIIIGDFNMELKESAMINFLHAYNMENLINKFTCYENLKNTSISINLMLTNKPRVFKNSSVRVTGISDFQKMTLTVMRAYFVK